MESSSHNFKELKSGELIAIVNELSNVFLGLLDKWCSKLFPNFLGIMIISIYYLYNNISLGVLFIILVTLRLYFTVDNGLQYADICASRDKKYFDMNESFNDLFNNMMNVHINNEQKTEKKKQGAINDDYNESQEEEMRTRKKYFNDCEFNNCCMFYYNIDLFIYFIQKKENKFRIINNNYFYRNKISRNIFRK